MKYLVLTSKFYGQAECSHVLYSHVSAFSLNDIHSKIAFPELAKMHRRKEISDKEFDESGSFLNIEDCVLCSTFFEKATQGYGWRKDGEVESRIVDTDNLYGEDVAWMHDHMPEDEFDIRRALPEGVTLINYTRKLYSPLKICKKTVLSYKDIDVVLRY